MSKRVLFFLIALFSATLLRAAGLPVVSTEGNDTWYLLQFLNGGKVIMAQTAGEVSVDMPSEKDAQWWKFTGSPTEGYMLTNKLGYVMHVSAAAKSQKVRVQKTATGVSTFMLSPVADGTAYEFLPKGNNQVAMNLWGGPSDNRGVGLWDKSDPNNPIALVSEKEYNALGQISIVPYPQELEIVREGLMPLTQLQAITYPTEETKSYVEDFAQQLEKTSGVKLVVRPTANTAQMGEIALLIDQQQPAEGYILQVTEGKVAIKAATKAGFFYALQTLKQMLPRAFFTSTFQKEVEWGLPYLNITDAPQLGYRGFMLDVARHFFTKEEIKRMLDVMALYKMNRFHWHLTDDQGWRIEMPQYPRLTQVGAIRSGSFSNPGEGTAFFDDTEYGRGLYFTKTDLQEIVAYAQERNIEILPEVDLPGHMVAAIAAYPEFSCNPDKPYEVRVNAGISHDVLNIGDDKVIQFLEDVMDFLAEVFPYPYIHLGGDECPTDEWKKNAQCLARIKQHNLKGVDELQPWLVNHLGTYIQEKHQKGVVVWDELTLHWNKNFKIKPIVMAWNVLGDHKYPRSAPAQVAANLGLKSIYVPWNKLYLDFMQASPRDLRIDEPYHGGWGPNYVTSVHTVYHANPMSELTGKEEYAWGMQCNLWTETTNDAQEMEYQVLPRLLALSEAAWLPTAKKNWRGFYKRLQSQADILDILGYNYAKHAIEEKPMNPAQKVLQEAIKVLEQSHRAAVGYATAEAYDALSSALQTARPSIEGGGQQAAEQASILSQALEAFKQAPIVQPEAGKHYQIRSASTYYKRQFAGSSLYLSDKKLRIHYTPQVEPEELWQFVPTEGGFHLKSPLTNQLVQLPSYGQNATLHPTQGTTLRIDKATVPNGGYSYIPGVVVISSTQGYQPRHTGSVKRLNATLSGDVNALDSLGLCHSGTWIITEVNDFSAQLKGLSRKAELTLLTAKAGEMGHPTIEALDFLRQQVFLPAQEALTKGGITEGIYKEYAQRYARFLAMERVTILASLSTQHYYRLRNVWFADKYATANMAKRVVPATLNNSDMQLWSITKMPDGTVQIYNKGTTTAAYLNKDATDQAVLLGKPYGWTLEERTLDGKTGICIMDPGKTISWYINPASWNYVLTKPFWGASTWTFEKTQEKVPASIDRLPTATQEEHFFDLSGRRVQRPRSGLYLNNRGEKKWVK